MGLDKRGWVLILLAAGCVISLSLAGYLVYTSYQAASQSAVQETTLAQAVTSSARLALLAGTPTFPDLPAVPTLQPTPEMIPPALVPMNSPIPTVAYTVEAKDTCVITATGGLVTEMRTIIEKIPGPGTNSMVIPDEAQMAAWQNVIRLLLNDDLRAACTLIRENSFPYHILDFTDLPFHRERYYLLVEDQPLNVGWGTYVIRTQGVLSELVVEVPHPIADDRTELEGVDIFRQLHARAFLMAGTNRCADQSYSACSGTTIACGQVEPYRSSDVSHATRTMFQAAHLALVACGGPRVALQLHGNDLSTCPDLFISNGTLNPHQLSNLIFQRAAESCSPFTAGLAQGEGNECAFNSGSSVQAVYSNGCARFPEIDACQDFVGQPSNPEQFISVEQSMGLRKNYACFLDALKEIWP